MKQWIIAVLGVTFLGSLIFVQWMEILRKRQEAGADARHISIPAASRKCVDCHRQQSPGVVSHWHDSTHAAKGVGCVECHKANKKDADAYDHYGVTIATIVTPLDCARCHAQEFNEFTHSHHSRAGNILASLDNFLAETVEGSRAPFNPHMPAGGIEAVETPAGMIDMVNGMASAQTGCQQCHGSKIALVSNDGATITSDDLEPDENGVPTNKEAVARVMKDSTGKPVLAAGSWPNTGIGRLNLDGTRGSCSACHSRHDFSPRRARQPENCGKCHLGPDHPQKEIFEESKHGVAFRDMKEKMNLDGESWVLGTDYSQAPTCATCHMSGHTANDGKITHDPGERISWTNRPPVSLLMDTDAEGQVVKETDPSKRRDLIADTAEAKRNRMKNVCHHCHTPNYVNAFYKQYDDFVTLYNEKFGKTGTALMAKLREQDLITPMEFDEEIEWTWFYLWHHEGRRARHGASMMAPDYAHWHGMYEVAERFYMEMIPQAREIIAHAAAEGRTEQAAAATSLIEEILARPEHQWFEKELKKGAADAAAVKGKAPIVEEDAEVESAEEETDTEES
ncbi:MAG: multiheme c-type cytochrome [Pirellulales bacterium]